MSDHNISMQEIDWIMWGSHDRGEAVLWYSQRVAAAELTAQYSEPKTAADLLAYDVPQPELIRMRLAVTLENDDAHQGDDLIYYTFGNDHGACLRVLRDLWGQRGTPMSSVTDLLRQEGDL